MPIESKAIQHINSDPFDWDMLDQNLKSIWVKIRFGTTDKINTLSERIDWQFKRLKNQIDMKSETMQVEVTGRIILPSRE